MLLNILFSLQNPEPFLLKKKVSLLMLTAPGHCQNQKPKLMYNLCAIGNLYFHFAITNWTDMDTFGNFVSNSKLKFNIKIN